MRCALGWVGAVIELGVHNASPGNLRFTNCKLNFKRCVFFVYAKGFGLLGKSKRTVWLQDISAIRCI